MRRKDALPDFLQLDAVCRMPVKEIKVRIPGNWGSLSWDQVKAAWELGWKLWTDVVDLKVIVEKDPDVTHIAPTFARIDGMGSVLAWSEFPCPWSPPVLQKYDSSERYHLDLGEGTGTSLPLLIAHECGHALGLGHAPQGNVMQPYLDDSVKTLGPWDRAEILKRYGPAKPPIPDGGTMSKLLECVLKILPTFLECLFSATAEAKQSGQETPIEAIAKLLRK